jgi:hypothetical protein
LPHYEAKPVTLPRFDLPEVDEIEAKEVAARFAELRTIREGQDLWHEINRASSFENWKKIGAALSVGKNRSLFVSRANRAMGRTYSREFNQWIVEHRFDGMAKSLRSVAIEMHENIHAIEQWRTTLTDKQRRRLRGPLQNVRRWKRETGQTQSKRTNAISSSAPCESGAVARAKAAWRRFVSLCEALPPDLAAPLWHQTQATAAEVLGAKFGAKLHITG